MILAYDLFNFRSACRKWFIFHMWFMIYFQLWFLHMILLTCDSWPWVLSFHTWPLQMIHLFTDVTLTYSSFVYLQAWFLYMILLTWVIYFHTWPFQMIHLFTDVFLTYSSFIYRCDSFIWFIYLQMWFFHTVHLKFCFSHLILVHDSFIFTWFSHIDHPPHPHVISYCAISGHTMPKCTLTRYSRNHVTYLWLFLKGIDDLSTKP